MRPAGVLCSRPSNSQTIRGRAVKAAVCLAAFAISTVGFAAAGDPPTPAGTFVLNSTAFQDNGILQRKFAGNDKSSSNCVGENISPPFSWSNAPAATKSFAFLMVDPEGRNGLGVVHWLAYGISPSVNGFAEGEVSKESPKFVGGKSTRNLPTSARARPPATGTTTLSR